MDSGISSGTPAPLQRSGPGADEPREAYVQEHRIYEELNAVVAEMLTVMPEDPHGYLAEQLSRWSRRTYAGHGEAALPSSVADKYVVEANQTNPAALATESLLGNSTTSTTTASPTTTKGNESSRRTTATFLGGLPSSNGPSSAQTLEQSLTSMSRSDASTNESVLRSVVVSTAPPTLVDTQALVMPSQPGMDGFPPLEEFRIQVDEASDDDRDDEMSEDAPSARLAVGGSSQVDDADTSTTQSMDSTRRAATVPTIDIRLSESLHSPLDALSEELTRLQFSLRRSFQELHTHRSNASVSDMLIGGVDPAALFAPLGCSSSFLSADATAGDETKQGPGSRWAGTTARLKRPTVDLLAAAMMPPAAWEIPRVDGDEPTMVFLDVTDLCFSSAFDVVTGAREHEPVASILHALDFRSCLQLTYVILSAMASPRASWKTIVATCMVQLVGNRGVLVESALLRKLKFSLIHHLTAAVTQQHASLPSSSYLLAPNAPDGQHDTYATSPNAGGADARVDPHRLEAVARVAVEDVADELLRINQALWESNPSEVVVVVSSDVPSTRPDGAVVIITDDVLSQVAHVGDIYVLAGVERSVVLGLLHILACVPTRAKRGGEGQARHRTLDDEGKERLRSTTRRLVEELVRVGLCDAATVAHLAALAWRCLLFLATDDPSHTGASSPFTAAHLRDEPSFCGTTTTDDDALPFVCGARFVAGITSYVKNAVQQLWFDAMEREEMSLDLKCPAAVEALQLVDVELVSQLLGRSSSKALAAAHHVLCNVATGRATLNRLLFSLGCAGVFVHNLPSWCHALAAQLPSPSTAAPLLVPLWLTVVAQNLRGALRVVFDVKAIVDDDGTTSSSQALLDVKLHNALFRAAFPHSRAGSSLSASSATTSPTTTATASPMPSSTSSIAAAHSTNLSTSVPAGPSSATQSPFLGGASRGAVHENTADRGAAFAYDVLSPINRASMSTEDRHELCMQNSWNYLLLGRVVDNSRAWREALEVKLLRLAKAALHPDSVSQIASTFLVHSLQLELDLLLRHADEVDIDAARLRLSMVLRSVICTANVFLSMLMSCFLSDAPVRHRIAQQRALWLVNKRDIIDSALSNWGYRRLAGAAQAGLMGSATRTDGAGVTNAERLSPFAASGRISNEDREENHVATLVRAFSALFNARRSPEMTGSLLLEPPSTTAAGVGGGRSGVFVVSERKLDAYLLALASVGIWFGHVTRWHQRLVEAVVRATETSVEQWVLVFHELTQFALLRQSNLVRFTRRSHADLATLQRWQAAASSDDVLRRALSLTREGLESQGKSHLVAAIGEYSQRRQQCFSSLRALAMTSTISASHDYHGLRDVAVHDALNSLPVHAHYTFATALLHLASTTATSSTSSSNAAAPPNHGGVLVLVFLDRVVELLASMCLPKASDLASAATDMRGLLVTREGSAQPHSRSSSSRYYSSSAAASEEDIFAAIARKSDHGPLSTAALAEALPSSSATTGQALPSSAAPSPPSLSPLPLADAMIMSTWKSSFAANVVGAMLQTLPANQAYLRGWYAAYAVDACHRIYGALRCDDVMRITGVEFLNNLENSCYDLMIGGVTTDHFHGFSGALRRCLPGGSADLLTLLDCTAEIAFSFPTESDIQRIQFRLPRSSSDRLLAGFVAELGRLHREIPNNVAWPFFTSKLRENGGPLSTGSVASVSEAPPLPSANLSSRMLSLLVDGVLDLIHGVTNIEIAGESANVAVAMALLAACTCGGQHTGMALVSCFSVWLGSTFERGEDKAAWAHIMLKVFTYIETRIAAFFLLPAPQSTTTGGSEFVLHWSQVDEASLEKSCQRMSGEVYRDEGPDHSGRDASGGDAAQQFASGLFPTSFATFMKNVSRVVFDFASELYHGDAAVAGGGGSSTLLVDDARVGEALHDATNHLEKLSVCTTREVVVAVLLALEQCGGTPSTTPLSQLSLTNLSGSAFSRLRIALCAADMVCRELEDRRRTAIAHFLEHKKEALSWIAQLNDSWVPEGVSLDSSSSFGGELLLRRPLQLLGSEIAKLTQNFFQRSHLNCDEHGQFAAGSSPAGEHQQQHAHHHDFHSAHIDAFEFNAANATAAAAQNAKESRRGALPFGGVLPLFLYQGAALTDSIMSDMVPWFGLVPVDLLALLEGMNRFLSKKHSATSLLASKMSVRGGSVAAMAAAAAATHGKSTRRSVSSASMMIAAAGASEDSLTDAANMLRLSVFTVLNYMRRRSSALLAAATTTSAASHARHSPDLLRALVQSQSLAYVNLAKVDLAYKAQLASDWQVPYLAPSILGTSPSAARECGIKLKESPDEVVDFRVLTEVFVDVWLPASVAYCKTVCSTPHAAIGAVAAPGGAAGEIAVNTLRGLAVQLQADMYSTLATQRRLHLHHAVHLSPEEARAATEMWTTSLQFSSGSSLSLAAASAIFARCTGMPVSAAESALEALRRLVGQPWVNVALTQETFYGALLMFALHCSTNEEQLLLQLFAKQWGCVTHSLLILACRQGQLSCQQEPAQSASPGGSAADGDSEQPQSVRQGRIMVRYWRALRLLAWTLGSLRKAHNQDVHIGMISFASLSSELFRSADYHRGSQLFGGDAALVDPTGSSLVSLLSDLVEARRLKKVMQAFMAPSLRTWVEETVLSSLAPLQLRSSITKLHHALCSKELSGQSRGVSSWANQPLLRACEDVRLILVVMVLVMRVEDETRTTLQLLPPPSHIGALQVVQVSVEVCERSTRYAQALLFEGAVRDRVMRAALLAQPSAAVASTAAFNTRKFVDVLLRYVTDVVEEGVRNLVDAYSRYEALFLSVLAVSKPTFSQFLATSLAFLNACLAEPQVVQRLPAPSLITMVSTLCQTLKAGYFSTFAANPNDAAVAAPEPNGTPRRPSHEPLNSFTDAPGSESHKDNTGNSPSSPTSSNRERLADVPLSSIKVFAYGWLKLLPDLKYLYELTSVKLRRIAQVERGASKLSAVVLDADELRTLFHVCHTFAVTVAQASHDATTASRATHSPDSPYHRDSSHLPPSASSLGLSGGGSPRRNSSVGRESAVDPSLPALLSGGISRIAMRDVVRTGLSQSSRPPGQPLRYSLLSLNLAMRAMVEALDVYDGPEAQRELCTSATFRVSWNRALSFLFDAVALYVADVSSPHSSPVTVDVPLSELPPQPLPVAASPAPPPSNTTLAPAQAVSLSSSPPPQTNHLSESATSATETIESTPARFSAFQQQAQRSAAGDLNGNATISFASALVSSKVASGTETRGIHMASPATTAASPPWSSSEPSASTLVPHPPPAPPPSTQPASTSTALRPAPRANTDVATAEALGKPRIITREEIKQHQSRKDCWIVVHGEVFDVTPLMLSHPGGMGALMAQAGKDGTASFESNHPATSVARNSLRKYYVGEII